MVQGLSDAYEVAGNSPRAWWFVGMNLLLSAEILRGANRLTLPIDADVLDDQALRELQIATAVAGPALMLRAFGTEALLKAIFLQNGGVLTENGRYTSPTKRPHDLQKLAAASNVQAEQVVVDVLEKLEYWIQQGRYPIQSSLASYRSGGLGARPMRYDWTDDDEVAWLGLRSQLMQLGAPMRLERVESGAVEQGVEADEAR